MRARGRVAVAGGGGKCAIARLQEGETEIHGHMVGQSDRERGNER